MKTAPLVLLVLAACSPQTENHQAGDAPAPIDFEAQVVEVAESFATAIATHDSTLAAAALSSEVTILEGGGFESREEYLSHHFHSDAAFIGAMTRELLAREVTVNGHAAWIVTRSRLSGEFRDRSVDLTSLETMVLVHEGDAWRITSVHWSSRPNG